MPVKSSTHANGRVSSRNLWIFTTFLIVLNGCASSPPERQQDVCQVFAQEPAWFDYARASEKRWGTPASVLMSFVKQESAYRHDARPPRPWFFIIPLPRKSSAQGYAQAQDAAWSEYKRDVGGLFRSRSDMEDALDFIGWYNDKSSRRLGLDKSDARNLYLAYHEGHGGYSRGSYKSKAWLKETAGRVASIASQYRAQLARCQSQFKCRKWYQAWPWCS